jgi:lipopolysaccharide export system protein LptC
MEQAMPEPAPEASSETLPAAAPVQPQPAAPQSRNARAWLAHRSRGDALAPRYSRFVEIVKLVLPLTAVALVLLVFGYSMFTRQPESLTLTFADLARLGGDRVVTNPTLTFTDEDSRAFVVKATRAKQLDGQSELWRLENIRGRMNKPVGPGYNLTSTHGVLNTKSEVMDLEGAIAVKSDDGYAFYATSARVDMQAGEVTSTSAVHGAGPTGSIEAESFLLRDRGQQLSFVGNVHFRARPDDDKAAP